MSKKTTIILIVILIVVAGLLFWSMKKGSVSNVDTNTGQSSESTEDTSAGSINAGASATMSYADALSKYKSARLEFDKDCKANPKSLNLPNNSFLLIDNQSSSDRVVKVGTLMNIRANSFKIVNVENATSGPTWNIDCDQSTNVATVLIQ